jgi:hypothetical protein
VASKDAYLAAAASFETPACESLGIALEEIKDVLRGLYDFIKTVETLSLQVDRLRLSVAGKRAQPRPMTEFRHANSVNMLIESINQMKESLQELKDGAEQKKLTSKWESLVSEIQGNLSKLEAKSIKYPTYDLFINALQPVLQDPAAVTCQLIKYRPPPRSSAATTTLRAPKRSHSELDHPDELKSAQYPSAGDTAEVPSLDKEDENSGEERESQSLDSGYVSSSV